MTGLGHHPLARWSTPAPTGGPGDRVPFGHGALLGQRLQMPADSSRREPEQAAQRGGGHRATLGHRGQDTGAGARLLLGMPLARLDNHNASMS